MAQLVEHILGKDEVPGPNPGSSSRQPRRFYLRGFGFYSLFLLLPGSAPGKDTRYALNLEEPTGLFTVRIEMPLKTP